MSEMITRDEGNCNRIPKTNVSTWCEELNISNTLLVCLFVVPAAQSARQQASHTEWQGRPATEWQGRCAENCRATNHKGGMRLSQQCSWLQDAFLTGVLLLISLWCLFMAAQTDFLNLHLGYELFCVFSLC